VTDSLRKMGPAQNSLYKSVCACPDWRLAVTEDDGKSQEAVPQSLPFITQINNLPS
jgi:hypothetical protein